MRLAAIAAAALLCLAAPPAHAGTVTVATAAGISITVADDDFAGRIAGFIGDLVARGIRPSQINCLNFAHSHVPGSLHYTGHACDFDGSASRFAPMNGHRVSDLARKWGLRDGCDFSVTVGKGPKRRRVPDCGHIDAGRGRVLLAQTERPRHAHNARAHPRVHRHHHRHTRTVRARAHRGRA